jgi:hypothetical protein
MGLFTVFHNRPMLEKKTKAAPKLHCVWIGRGNKYTQSKRA